MTRSGPSLCTGRQRQARKEILQQQVLQQQEQRQQQEHRRRGCPRLYKHVELLPVGLLGPLRARRLQNEGVYALRSKCYASILPIDIRTLFQMCQYTSHPIPPHFTWESICLGLRK